MTTILQWILFSLTLLFLTDTYALHPKPDTCPEIVDVQKEGMTKTDQVQLNIFMTYTLNHFNTPISWLFLMGPIHEASANGALSKGNHILASISATPEPTYDGDNGWICLYPTGVKDIAAFAIQTDDMLSAVQLKDFLKKI
jgi:hypothetical protein